MFKLAKTFVLLTNFHILLSKRLYMMSAERGSLLSCQKNAYLRESINQVLSCEKVSCTSDRYRVILDDSVLYPEGGGQPYDLGTVDGVEVLKVTKAEGGVGVALEISHPLSVGVGRQVKCVVDWQALLANESRDYGLVVWQ
ncbi:hypothetical protein EON63_12130 [archaeon]|nr:MAG: hypothetical protein EON63_12130 [archaeon]